jgi:hypothetical protein
MVMMMMMIIKMIKIIRDQLVLFAVNDNAIYFNKLSFALASGYKWRK